MLMLDALSIVGFDGRCFVLFDVALPATVLRFWSYHMPWDYESLASVGTADGRRRCDPHSRPNFQIWLAFEMEGESFIFEIWGCPIPSNVSFPRFRNAGAFMQHRGTSTSTVAQSLSEASTRGL